jgi:aspartokinase
MRNVVALVRGHSGPLVVVVSALGGVTDALLEGARHAASGDASAAAHVAAAFLRRHRDIAIELVPPGKERRAVLASVDHQAREYRDIAQAVAALGELSPRASDTLIARGERAASAALAAALNAAGHRAERIDATGFVTTDGRHGAAAPDIPATRRKARKVLTGRLRRGITPVVPGFHRRWSHGPLTTLSRGSTGPAATLLLAGPGHPSRPVEDVPGV